MKKVFLILGVSFLVLSGCAKKELPPPNYPDFSTPEASFLTGAYAAKYKDYPVFIDSLASEYQQKFGKTKNEQLVNLEAEGKKTPIHKDRTLKITKIEDVKSNPEYDVKMFDYIRNNKVFLKGWTPLKKINGQWKTVFLKEWEPKHIR